jgi:hypothetical protein
MVPGGIGIGVAARLPCRPWSRREPVLLAPIASGSRALPDLRQEGAVRVVGTGVFGEIGVMRRGAGVQDRYKVQTKMYVQCTLLQTGHYCALVHTSSGSWHITLS